MPLFSTHFNIPYDQAQLDFFDCNTDEDRKLYVDPYAISQMPDHWSKRCQEYLESYFSELLNVLAQGNPSREIEMTSHFGEPGDTFIGESAGPPQGRGIADVQAGQIVSAIKNSKAVKTGMLSDLSEITMYIKGIDRDKISDLTTNVIRDVLYDYTTEQCDLHGVKMDNVSSSPHWDMSMKNWRSSYRSRPHINGQPVLLIPKVILRHTVSLRGRAFYNSGMTNFLQAEHLAKGSKLVHYIGKKRRARVNKKDVKTEHPFSKDFVAEFIDNNPAVYSEYKRDLRIANTVSLTDICTPKGQMVKFNGSLFAGTLASQLRAIPPGKAAANDFHEFILGALTFLFYPYLSRPTKEAYLNSGRKRIDITFDNTAESGFFRSLATAPDIQSKIISIECKNYSKDIANPELDQLIGRLSPKRGMFGLLVCRKDDKPDLTFQRTKDAFNDSQGHIIVLTDDDIVDMLEAYTISESSIHLNVLRNKFRKLIL